MRKYRIVTNKTKRGYITLHQSRWTRRLMHLYMKSCLQQLVGLKGLHVQDAHVEDLNILKWYSYGIVCCIVFERWNKEVMCACQNITIKYFVKLRLWSNFDQGLSLTGNRFTKIKIYQPGWPDVTIGSMSDSKWIQHTSKINHTPIHHPF